MDETDILRTELEHYKTERERIKKIIGQIGGTNTKTRDFFINTLFLIVIVFLFVFDVIRDIFGVSIHHIPPNLSIEIALLLVSLKIIWMIHKQTKVDHFQFWMLNSIEFQIASVGQKLRDLEKRVKETGKKSVY